MKRFTKADVDAQNRKVAKIDTGYRCVMKPPKKATVLTSQKYDATVDVLVPGWQIFSYKEHKSFMIKTRPVSAPRMTQRDKWKQRPIVMEYFEYRDKLRLVVGELPSVPDRLDCKFYIPMPDSWSKKKKARMNGQPHRAGRLDYDNLSKGVNDSLFDQDGGIWAASQEKRWCMPGEERVVLDMTWL